MKFGPVPLEEAEGAILAHSVRHAGGVIKKGGPLTAADIAALLQDGQSQVIAARLGPEDVAEDDAARRIAALVPGGAGISTSAPFTGRVNLYAESAGVLRLDASLIDRVNRIDEALTIATLPDFARVHPRQMLATIKVIPYAAPEAAVAAAEDLLRGALPLRLHAFQTRSASLILTRLPGMGAKVIEKGGRVIRDRAAALSLDIADEQVVAHRTDAIREAVSAAAGEMVLLLTASATSDRADVGPAGVEAAGGRIHRFGMPVDPGNLLFLATHRGRPVIGLPGCARSPKLNGADWVLERLAAGLDVAPDDIAAMGVGGLLKEIPSRPKPRAGGEEAPRRPVVAALLLAAGSARRMKGRDKLMEEVDGSPLIRRVATAALDSAVEHVVAVLRDKDHRRSTALDDLPLETLANPRAGEGMGTSIAAGIRTLGPEVDAVLIVMADMPEIRARDINRLIAAFDPGESRAIIRATTEGGQPGHPVLFGRRFFEPLAALEGDTGARDLVREHPDFVTDIPLEAEAATTDLDTPEAWAAWRAARA